MIQYRFRCVVLVLVSALMPSGCDWKKAKPKPPDPTPLLTAMNKRLELMEPIAQAKWNAGLDIYDAERERLFLNSISDKAEAVGVSPAFARLFFQAQIDAGKMIQQDLFAKWTEADQGRFPGAADLENELRPEIDAASQELLVQLAQFERDPSAHEQITAQADKLIAFPLITPAIRQTALAPLLR